jgi:hypothetical protein
MPRRLSRASVVRVLRPRQTRTALALLCFASDPQRSQLRRRIHHACLRARRMPRRSGVVQPASVRSTAWARSASPRSREQARTAKAECCSSLVERGDLPVMSCTCESASARNQAAKHWSTNRSLLRFLRASGRRGSVRLGAQHRRNGGHALVDHLSQPLKERLVLALSHRNTVRRSPAARVA